jgi:hypothetical protein
VYHQYQQFLSFTVVGGGSPLAPTAAGTSLGVAYAPSLTTSTTAYWFDASGSLKISTPSSGSNEQWAPSPASILASQTNTQVVSIYNEYQVTFSQTGVNSGAGSNTVLAVGSTNYAYNALPSNLWVNSGTNFSWVSIISGGSGTQFVLTGSSGSSPILAAGTYSATYKTQYLFIFSSSGLSGDATGNLVTFSVSGGSYSGPSSPVSVAGGSIWVDSGASISYSFAGPVTSSITGKQYRMLPRLQFLNPMWLSGRCLLLLVLLEVDQHLLLVLMFGRMLVLLAYLQQQIVVTRSKLGQALGQSHLTAQVLCLLLQR